MARSGKAIFLSTFKGGTGAYIVMVREKELAERIRESFDEGTSRVAGAVWEVKFRGKLIHRRED